MLILYTVKRSELIMKVNKWIYFILAFFLGGFGAHKFYSKNNIGYLYLIFCWTGIPGVIGIIEGVSALLKKEDEAGNIVL